MGALYKAFSSSLITMEDTGQETTLHTSMNNLRGTRLLVGFAALVYAGIVYLCWPIAMWKMALYVAGLGVLTIGSALWELRS